MKKFKFSRAYVAQFMYRFAFLLFVPFLQGLLFSSYGFDKLFALYSIDIALIILLLAIAFLRQRKASLRISDKAFLINYGVLIKREDRTFAKSTNLTLLRPLLLRLFRAGRLRISSGLGVSNAYLKTKDALALFEQEEKDHTKTFRSPILRTALMSAVFSNSLTGLLAAVPFLRRTASLLGARQTALLIQGVSLEGWLALRGLPPFISRVSSILFTCWAIGFFTEFFREYNLSLSFSDNDILISKGLVTLSHVKFSKESVRALTAKQSILLFFCGLYSVQAAVNLSPKRKIHILSATGRARCCDVEELIFGKDSKPVKSASPPFEALHSYTLLPFFLISFISLIIIFFGSGLFTLLPAGIALSLSVIFYFFRICGFFRSSITIWQDKCEIRYFSGMNFVRTIFRKENIISVTLSQNPFQLLSRRCNLKITLRHTKSLKLRIKHLEKNSADDIRKMLIL